MMLVGDIGGTNARLALARRDGAHYRLDHLQRYDTPDDLPALVRHYLDAFATDALTGAALCGAGPLREDGSIALTNHPCVLDPAALADAARVPLAHVVNDFQAVGQAIPALSHDDLKTCGGITTGDPRAPRLVLGAGTGLGVASLLSYRNDWIVLPGEGGHVDLAPVDDEEHAVWQILRRDHGALSAESLLAGPGFERLYHALSGRTLPAPDIAAAAHARDEYALRAIAMFTRWLGRVAGNAALTLGAQGGVYIGGGIVPGWGALFEPAVFRAGFEDKRGFENWLRRIPAWVITHPQPGLIGLARLAERA